MPAQIPTMIPATTKPPTTTSDSARFFHVSCGGATSFTTGRGGGVLVV